MHKVGVTMQSIVDSGRSFDKYENSGTERIAHDVFLLGSIP